MSIATRSTRTPYATHLVVAHTGFKVPANSLTEAEAIKTRLDARYPGETPAQIRLVAS